MSSERASEDIKRTPSEAFTPVVYEFAGYSLDPVQRRLTRDSVTVPLTSKAFDVLLLLVRNSGRVISRDEFLSEVWPDAVVEEANLTQVVFTLRKMFGEKPKDPRFIVTVPGKGYQFAVAVQTRETGGPPAAATRKVRPGRAVAASIAAALAVFGLAALLLSMKGPATVEMRFLPLVLAGGKPAMPAWSPDSKSIAYLAGIENGTGLFVHGLHSPPGEPLIRIGSQLRERVFWASDGFIYYRVGRELFRIKPPSTAPEPVLNGLAFEGVELSRDGRSIATLLPEGESVFTLASASPPGAPWKAYAGVPRVQSGSPNGIRIAPDNRQALFITADSQRFAQFWLLDWPASTPARPPRRIFESVHTSRRIGVSWLPDSRSVVLSLADESSGVKHLWAGDIERNQVRRLTETSTDESAPEISPDGHRIAYIQTDLNTDLIEIPLDGSPVRTLLATARREEYPSWCGGDRYVYLTNRSGTPELWVGDTVHGSQRPVVSQNDFADQTLEIEPPTCSPDSAAVAYRRRTREGTAIWISPLAGGRPVRLMEGGNVRTPLTWSPDSAWLAFGGLDGAGGGAVFKIATKSPQAPILVRKGLSPLANGWSSMSGVAPAWSPTGEWLTVRSTEGFGVVSTDGSRLKILVSRFQNAPAGGHAWSADGSRILYTLLEDDRTLLHSVEVVSGKDRVIRDLGPNVMFSPDAYTWHRHAFNGTRNALATQISRHVASTWILEGFEQRLSRRPLLLLTLPSSQ